jgi:O-succinylbenzoate synthase
MRRERITLQKNILAPLLIGKDIRSSVELNELFRHLKGHQFIKAAFDCAWWDAFAQSKERPLWDLIGGVNKNVAVGADLPVQPSQTSLLQKVGEVAGQGFKRVKIKFNRECTVRMISDVRETFPDLLIHIDCNSGFSLDDEDLFLELDQLGLSMIEQPLAYDDLFYHSLLQEKLITPICLDESITSVDRALKAIKMGSCGWINIKTSRVGGLSNAIEINDLCRKNDMPVWVGGMLESAVGQGFSLALATMDNVGYPCDIFPSRRFYEKDIASPEIVLEEPGVVVAPSRAGVGFSPNKEVIRAASLDSANFFSS